MGSGLSRTYVLTSAYKQHGMHPSDGDLGRLAVKTPSSELAFLATNTIPFGAVGGVCGLLRISTALTLAGPKGPELWGTSFHDAFTVFSDARAIPFAAVKAEALFDRWGARFTIASRKAVDFSAM